MTNTFATYLRFFWAGLVKRGQTGAIVPSQRFLVETMIAPVPENYRGRIIELGAGTGALTARLAARCPEAAILACEINPVLARETRRHLAADGLNGQVNLITCSAESLLAGLGGDEVAKPDFIISGIPLANLGGQRAAALIDAIHRALRPGGYYIQFQHSLWDRKKIVASFADLRIAPVLLNFPPAFVYYARKN